MPVRHIDGLDEFCRENLPCVAVLCVPVDAAREVVPQLVSLGIRSFLNFSHYDIAVDYPDCTVENVHLGDSMMTLCYRANQREASGLPCLGRETERRMKQIHNGPVLDVVASTNGFVFAAQQDSTEDGRAIVEYKTCDFVSRKKAGKHHPKPVPADQIRGFVRTICRSSAAVSDLYDGFLSQRGFAACGSGRQCPPYGAGWPLPVRGAIPLPGLRAGSGGDCQQRGLGLLFPSGRGIALRHPNHAGNLPLRRRHRRRCCLGAHGLWFEGDILFVCCRESGRIVQINLRNYHMEDHHLFTEPVNAFMKVQATEIVWLQSGIYKI